MILPLLHVHVKAPDVNIRGFLLNAQSKSGKFAD